MGERRQGPGPRAQQRGCGVDMLSTEAMLGLGPDSHNPMGKGLEPKLLYLGIIYIQCLVCVP